MQTFKIFTFGCKTNQQESDYMCQELENSGFIKKLQEENTDYTIINSCSVTSNADNEILYLIRKQKKMEPDTKIVLTGCLAQADKDNLEKDSNIYMILGNDEKLKIAAYIQDTQNKCRVDNLLVKTDFEEFTLHNTQKTRATLKIQDGCNNFCTYCIVPFTRGKSRSSHINNVISNIKEYINNGYKEIVLSAIHLGLWGLDFTPQMKLVDLLREIEKIDNMPRYRLGSLDPGELDDELIDFIINSKLVCNHLHISLQNACDKTLKNMNRHYTVAETFEKLNKLNNNIKHLNIGADVIVGFPDETEEDFLTSLNNIKAMPISYMHVFPYSKRQFTKAAGMQNQIEENIKLKRAKILRNVATEKQNSFLNSLIGTTQSVLIEYKKDCNNFYKGVASNYTKFLIECDKNIGNNVVDVQVEKVENKKIFAKINIL